MPRPPTRGGRPGTWGRSGPSRPSARSWPARPTRCRPRATDFGLSTWIDEVDRAHVDAELQRRRRDEARDLARLQELLDDEPLLARERPVVRPGDLLPCELVDPQREPLGEPPVVDEDDGRAVRADELEDRRVDRRPDRAALRSTPTPISTPSASGGHGERGRRVELAHVLDGNDDLEVELLAHAGVDELDLAPGPGDETADLLHRSLRRREADALERALDQSLEPLEREREVSAALRSGDCVHLVEDDRLDPAQRLPRLRGQEQEERLGSRDQDVRRRPQHPPSLARPAYLPSARRPRASSRARRGGCGGSARCRS